MKTDLINQYAHTWRAFERLVGDFDPEAWLCAGRKPITPACLAFHILQATKYYQADASVVYFESGKPFDIDPKAVSTEVLPSQKELLACIHDFSAKTEKWLSDMDLGAENQAFPWAGKTQFGVALFLLRHSLYHLGELSALLNESKNGEVEDHYVKAL